MVCVVCSCCATSPYRELCRAKGGIGSGETSCHDIYPARPITTVSLAANTYSWWMAIAHVHLAPWAPGSNSAVRVNRAINDWPGIQQAAICYQWFKQRLILSVSKPSISQRSQIKEDTVKPSVPAREFNLTAYAAITWRNDRASTGLEPRLADHCSQAVRSATYQQHHRGRPINNNHWMAIYLGQPGWAGTRTFTNINPICHLHYPQIYHFPPSLPLGSNIKNSGETAEKKHEEPEDKNPHFLYTRLILDLMRPL